MKTLAALAITALMISMMMTTAEDRAAARKRIKRYTRPAAPFVIALWAWIIWAAVLPA